MLVSMLYTDVKPLSSYRPECEKRQKEKAANRVVKPAHVKRHTNSIEKYRKAMGNAWVSTKIIEDRLGFCRASALGTLRGWQDKGIVECRKLGGDDNWCFYKGYEWRFCNNGEEK